MKTKLMFYIAAFAVCFAGAQQPDARAAYQQQQAIQEVQRLAQQFDQMESNFESISARMNRLENGNSAADMRAEISGLKAQIAEIKREQENMRREIVAEISRKRAGLLAQRQPPPAASTPAPVSHGRTVGGTGAKPQPAKPARAVPEGPYYEHVVVSGQTLTEIAKGYETTVQKILAANPGLKANALKVGQKVIVPAEDKK